MIKVLFICHGNICRSPMAEFILKDIVAKAGRADDFLIESAATSYEEIPNGRGNPIYPPAKRKLSMHGITGFDDKRARKLVRSDFEEYDYLIAMEEFNLKNIFREFGQELAGRVTTLLGYTSRGGDIADPWYTGNFDITYDDIVEGCSAFLEHMKVHDK